MLGLDLIRKLKPCKWKYNYHLADDKTYMGFIAQEVNELLNNKEYAVVHVNKEGVYSIDLAQLIAPTVKAVQELDKRISDLEGKNNG